ncbi:hypothetical protein JG688_00004396 [Phytophthora aleatoria]|uniref:F-box domain-containing protein n=1 Tax=Phytophthora aleatoria TaxID=2496075 RepID=A0A8J5JE19_9STRA|nr:hypothetical protein JG688_00004396 [Phytophthora aleatoria]
MAGKKRLTPLAPRARKRDEDSDDEDDVPLARILQRRRLAAKASPKRKNGARTAVTATNATVLPLNEVVERCIIELLPVVPDRQRVEAVCRRWRRLSREELPVTELDFGQVALRPLLRRDVSTMLGRASQQLTRLILPDITLVDAHIELIVQQQNLRVFLAHRMQKKHIFNILKHCPNLKTLELLDCRALTLSGWPRDAVALREVYLNGCNFVTNQAASSMIKVCGNTLEKVILTEAMNLDSQILRDLARHAGKLEELTISNCTSDCRAISDNGITALASSDDSEGCTSLEIVDLKIQAYMHLKRSVLAFTWCVLTHVERKKIEMIDPSKSSSESDESESDQDANDDYVIEVRRIVTMGLKAYKAGRRRR